MMGIYRSREWKTGGEGFEVRERDTNRLAIFHGVLVRKGFQPRTVLLKAVLQTRDKGKLVPRCRQRERKLRRFASFDFSHVREEYVPREESHSQGPFRCHIVPSLPSMSAANIIRLSFVAIPFFSSTIPFSPGKLSAFLLQYCESPVYETAGSWLRSLRLLPSKY